MQDLLRHGKALFWALLAAFLCLAALPSLVVLDCARQYYRFLTGWEPGTLRSLRARALPHRGPQEPLEAALRFVEFRLAAPKAKSVLLSGDFNRWDPKALPLARAGAGPWEVLLPLPPGRYEYVFLVDGTWTRDPQARESGRRGELETSVRVIQ